MAKKKMSKAARVREYAQQWPDEFDDYSPSAIASEIGGGVTASDVSMERARLKRASDKSVLVTNEAKVQKKAVRKPTKKVTSTSPIKLSIDLVNGGPLSLALKCSKSRALCTMEISETGLTLRRANKKTINNEVKWDTLHRLVEAGFLS